MKSPTERGGEEDPGVADGGGGAEEEGQFMRTGNGEGGGHDAAVGGTMAGWVEEHEFGFVHVRDKAIRLEPCEDLGDGTCKVHGHRIVGGAGGIDSPIIDIEGEVFRFQLHSFVKEWGSEEGGEDRGQGRALWGPDLGRKARRRKIVKG